MPNPRNNHLSTSASYTYAQPQEQTIPCQLRCVLRCSCSLPDMLLTAPIYRCPSPTSYLPEEGGEAPRWLLLLSRDNEEAEPPSLPPPLLPGPPKPPSATLSLPDAGSSPWPVLCRGLSLGDPPSRPSRPSCVTPAPAEAMQAVLG